MKVSLIVGRARNGVIGRDGDLPWRLPADLAQFKRRTMGHHLIMGRRTFESLPGILPGRPHVVLTRDASFRAEGACICLSLPTALEVARAAGDDEAFVIGGGVLYREALAIADRVYMTRVHADVAGDVTFDELEVAQWDEVEREDNEADDRHAHSFSVCVYERRR
ncbi:MAG: dihydrofolate reductase [Nannocystaceae bacterium]|nr:dihydrofolate reductase [Nannocystaceae bacterium]